MKKLFTICVTVFMMLQFAEAQNGVLNGTLLEAGKSRISPATTAFDGNTILSADYFSNWTGTDGAPHEISLNYSGPIYKNIVTGFEIKQFESGNFVHFNPSFVLATHIKLFEQSYLRFGLQTAYRSVFYSSAQTGSSTIDPVLLQSDALNTKRLYWDVGMAWQYKAMTVGVFSKQLAGIYIRNPFQYGDDRSLGAHADYRYRLHPDHAICFSGMMQIFPVEHYSRLWYSGEINWNFKQRIYAGVSYSKNMTVGLSAGVALSERLVMFYSYAFDYGGTVLSAGGSHRLMLSMLIKRKQIPDAADLFPVSETEKANIRLQKMQEEYQKELEKLKQHFNKTIYEYDERIKELEEKIQREGL